MSEQITLRPIDNVENKLISYVLGSEPIKIELPPKLSTAYIYTYALPAGWRTNYGSKAKRWLRFLNDIGQKGILRAYSEKHAILTLKKSEEEKYHIIIEMSDKYRKNLLQWNLVSNLWN